MAEPTVNERITEYLTNGGLFNPELMDHNAVRDLLMDARTEITDLMDAYLYYAQLFKKTVERKHILENALRKIDQATISHVDGRDLLDELHPRRTLDIKRRVDGVETWFEGDWLSNLRDARNEARAALEGKKDE
jgi:hypothetical protein